ncbi:MAG: hypothetical protein KF777_22720 [Planctomycetaceae bacterium]|nr:hypothetical protein [Planctomycetaceae bacterium]
MPRLRGICDGVAVPSKRGATMGHADPACVSNRYGVHLAEFDGSGWSGSNGPVAMSLQTASPGPSPYLSYWRLTGTWDGCGAGDGTYQSNCNPIPLLWYWTSSLACCPSGTTGYMQETGKFLPPLTSPRPAAPVEPCPRCDNTKCEPPNTSGEPIRYSSGEALISAQDVVSNGFGKPWGHTRSFSGRKMLGGKLGVPETIGNGYNWEVAEWPFLVLDRSSGGINPVSVSQIVVQGRAQQAIWFDRSGDSLVARFGLTHAMEYVAETESFRMTDPEGVVTDFDVGTGVFERQIDPNGTSIDVVEYTNSGYNIAAVERTYTIDSVTTTERLDYSYDSELGDTLLAQVTLRRKVGAGPWEDVSSALYTYYDYDEPHGSDEDLKTVTTRVSKDGQWVETGTTYYRYYPWFLDGSSSSSSSGGGQGLTINPTNHLVKFVVNPAAFERMEADGFDPLTASDSLLGLYADHYFEYNVDRQVTKELVRGGSETILYDYAEDLSFGDDYNFWRYKTTVTLADGSQNIAYSNYAGKVMLFVEISGTDRWITYYRYDGWAKVAWKALPSAVTGYDEAYDQLVTETNSSNPYQYIRQYAGRIQEYETDPVSRLTAHAWTREGRLGARTSLADYDYCGCVCASSSSSSSSSSGGNCDGPWFLSRETRYPSDTNQMLTEVTTYDYTFHPGTCAVQEKLTTFPVVSVAQNGTDVAATRRDVYDLYGNLTWAMDERGFITRMSYDIPTGAMTQRVDDVDTGLYPDAPAGWSTPSGGGLNLVTDYEHDRQGRITQTLGPAHEVDLDGVATSLRTASWAVYDDGDHTTYSGRGYAIGTSPSYAYTLVNPVSITKTDAGGRVLEQIQGTAPSTSGTLADIIDTAGGGAAAFPQSSYTRWRTMQYTDCCLVESERVYHTIPASGEGTEGTNYDETVYGYDVRKRRNRTVTPGGTITRTVIDVRSLVTSVWIGTNDFGGTATDPSGGGAPGNNMKIVTESVYDDGIDGGDGYLTGQTQYASASDTRVTTFTYDYRGRRLTTDGEIDFFQKEYHDNLDRVVKTERYDTTAGGNLIARSETSYDARGRVYETIRYGVDPGTGTVGNALTDNTWYDASGNVLCSLPAGSFLFAKTEYDSLGRTAKQFTGYNPDADLSDPLGDGSPDSVTNDVILEQSETTYDDASNVLQTTFRQRYHNAPDTQLGELQDPSTSPKARVTYQAMYPDAIGRSQASADYGTNGGMVLSRPDTIPARSDTILVTSSTYDDAANLTTTTDPAGMVVCMEYDDVGRETAKIMNCTSSSSSSSSSGGGCTPCDDENVTVLTSYNADGNVATITAVNVATGNQVTEYVYGTTLANSELATSTLKRQEIYPDSVDGSDVILFSYNRQQQVTQVTDQGGTVHAFDFDKLGRQTQDRVSALGSGVDGTVRRIAMTYKVRGLKETITSYDNPAVGSGNILNECQFVYNDFGQLVTEYQSHDDAVNTSTTPSIGYTYEDGSENTIRPTGVVYPDGRELTYDYGEGGNINDRCSRIASIVDDDNTHLANYEYLGRSTFVQQDDTEPQMKWTLVDLDGDNDEDTGDIYSGFDRFGRVKDNRWYNYDAEEDVDRIQYGYDRAGNRIWRKNVVAASLSQEFDELYSYDAVHRLNDMARGTLNGSRTALTSSTFGQCWTLDATGNWQGFREDDTGDGTWDLVQSRASNPVNEITAISETSGPSWVTPTYSAAGNMTTLPQPNDPIQGYTATYDAWNRLVKLADGEDTVSEYAYDGAKRRVIQKAYVEGVLDEARHLYYTFDWRCVEELGDSSSGVKRQFVWGLRNIDDLIEGDRDTDANSMSIERLYSCQDPNWNVVALTNTAGDVEERYVYQSYGTPRFLTPAFASRASSSFRWEILCAGYRWETETELYNVRNRVLSSQLGSWVVRDPIGYQGGMQLYGYVGNNPETYYDAAGLQMTIPWGGGGISTSIPRIGPISLPRPTPYPMPFPPTIGVPEPMPITTHPFTPPFVPDLPFEQAGPMRYVCRGNPSNCDLSTLDKLTREVNDKCKNTKIGNCDGMKNAYWLMTWTDAQCEAADLVISNKLDCLNARIKREKTCFMGGNDNHRTQMEDVIRGIRNCEDKMRVNGCYDKTIIVNWVPGFI